jgi:uncharacterized repeat protein (TIGR02543 family)
MKKVISLLAAISIFCTALQFDIFAYSDNAAAEEADFVSVINPEDGEQYDKVQSEVGEEEEPDFAEDRVIVKVKDSVSTMSAESDQNDGTFFGVDVAGEQVLSSVDGASIMSNGSTDDSSTDGTIMLLTLNESGEDKVLSAIETLESNPQILYAEPDYVVKAEAVPDDTYYKKYLYGMEKISAPEAWDTTTGSKDIVIGIIDTGIDYTHEDLAANMWVNEDEIPNNGIDDDNDGYIDDYYGWNFAYNTSDPMDDNYHGTHVASTAGAVGNNGTGVAGVSWNVSLMAIKVLDSDGSGYTSNIILGIEYAGQMGVYITNNSYSTTSYSQAEKDVINKYSDRLFVAAAGNSGVNNNYTPDYPASFDCDNIISVAASDADDKCADFSNYGLGTVDIFAPGDSILGAYPGNKYALLDGTSMASPHVAGAAALIKSVHPDYTTEQLKEAILEQSDKIPDLAPYVKYGARLNVAKALESVEYSDIESLTLNAEETTIKTHERIKLAADPVPFNVENKDVEWTSSDESIATVSDSGSVQAQEKEGSTVITATSKANGSVTASCTVTVSGESEEIEFQDLNFKKAVISSMQQASHLWIDDYPLCDMEEYNDMTLSSVIYDHDAEKVKYISALSRGISDMSGIEYFKNLGQLDCRQNEIRKLDISALDKIYYLSCANNLLTDLKVNPDAPWSYFVISKNYLDISETSDLGAILPAIKAKAKTYLATPQYSIGEIDSIEIEGGDITMAQRDARLLRAVVAPVDVSTLGVVWTSSDPDIASINSKGTLVANSSGTATITAISEVNPEFSTSINVTVTDKTADPVTFKSSTFRSAVVSTLINQDTAYNGYTRTTPLYPDDLNKITSISISPMVWGTQFYNADILKLASLEEITLTCCGVADIDWRELTNLKKISLSNQYPCQSINLSGLMQLTTLVFNNWTNVFPSTFNIDGCMNLSQIYVDSLNIDSLDLSDFTKMTYMYINGTSIKDLKLGDMSQLYVLDCKNNQIESLDLSKMSSLQDFYGSFNNMTELKLPEDNHEFVEFECAYNYLDTSSDSQFMQDMASLKCDETPIYLPQKIKSTPAIELSEKYFDMSAGESHTFTAACSSQLEENPALVWSSSDSNVASVDENGNVTAVSSGTAYITVHPDGNSDISASSLVKVFSSATDGEGTSSSPYILKTKEDILFLSGITSSGEFDRRRKFLDSYYILEPENGEYIDMEGAELTPIGYGYPTYQINYGGYTKTFDGNDKEIRNFSITVSQSDGLDLYSSDVFVGFFSRISEGGKVQNLSLANAKVNVSITEDEGAALEAMTCGILAGYVLAADGEIRNVSVSGEVTADGFATAAGGICGYGCRKFYSCAADVDVTATEATDGVGGICGSGEYYSYFYNCYSVGNIKGGNNVGGIAGSGVIVSRCYSLGSVSGEENVGGIIGYISQSSGNLTNSFSGANVSGETDVGAIIGYSVLSDSSMTELYSLEGQVVEEKSNEIGDTMTLSQLYNNECMTTFFSDSSKTYFENEVNHNPKVYKYNRNTLVAHQPDVVMFEDVPKVTITAEKDNITVTNREYAFGTNENREYYIYFDIAYDNADSILWTSDESAALDLLEINTTGTIEALSSGHTVTVDENKNTVRLGVKVKDISGTDGDSTVQVQLKSGTALKGTAEDKGAQSPVVTVTADNTEPSDGTVAFSTTAMTNQDVTATLTTDTPVCLAGRNEFKTENSIDIKENGEYTFVFYNELGVEHKQSYSVTWIDKEAPQITLNGDSNLTLTVGDEYTELGAVVTDNLDTDISSRLQISGTVDTSKAGTYVIKYNVTDQAGNAAEEVSRTVTVNEPTAYTVTFDYNDATGGNTPANKTVTYNSEYGTLPTPTKIGYAFAGWYTADDEEVTSETVVTATENHTLYAKWTECSHEWDSGTVTLEATCTREGSELLTCTKCAKTETETIPMLSHTLVTDAAVGATCETTGKTEGSHCSVCDTVITEQTEIAALGHDWGEWSITQDPTETEKGSAERICKNDSSHKDTAELPNLSDISVWQKISNVEPTCTDSGSQTYTSDYGTVTTTVNAKGHTVVTDNAVEATCETTGKTEGSHCSVCDTVITEQTEIAALGHDWGAWGITQAPTETEKGSAERICKNDSSHKDTAELPNLSDETVWTKGEYTAPTAAADGSQEYISEYGSVTAVIPALAQTDIPTDRVEFEKIGNVVLAKLIFEKTTPPPQEDIRLYVVYKENGILKRVEMPSITDMAAEFTIQDELQNCDISVYVWDKEMKPLMDVQKADI